MSEIDEKIERNIPAADEDVEPLSMGEFMEAMGEHLDELRRRLLIALSGLAAGVILGLVFIDPIMKILCRPIGGMEQLRSIEVTENVVAVFRVAMLAGFILAMPLIAYEVLAFVLPALKNNEKHALFTFLPLIVIFFLCGVAFSYFILLPVAVPFLTSFMDIKTEVRPANYVSFATNMLFWIGVVFEMPIVIYIPAKMGLVTAKQLLKNWRQAVVVCAILAMIITPTVDPVNMVILMVPLIALFFLSVLFAKLAENRRNKEASE